jgi:hypothetical protein
MRLGGPFFETIHSPDDWVQALGYNRIVGLNQKTTKPSNSTLLSNSVSYFYLHNNLNVPASARIESIKISKRANEGYSVNLNVRAKNRSGEVRPSYYMYVWSSPVNVDS